MRRFLTDVHRKVYLAECIIKTDLKIRMGVSECVLYICSVNSKNVANKYAFIWENGSSLSFVKHGLVLQRISEHIKWSVNHLLMDH